MWIEITDENKRKVLVNLDNVTQITDSGEETDHKDYLFFMSILSNCYWVFDSKEEKDYEYCKLKQLLGFLLEKKPDFYNKPMSLSDICDHEWIILTSYPPKFKCRKCNEDR